MKADPILVASYSEALFEAAKKAGVLDEIAEQASEIARLVEGERKLIAFMEAPNIPLEDKERVFLKIFGGKYNELLINFVRLLIRRSRLQIFFPGLEAFRDRYRKHLGIAAATIITAFSLSVEQKEQLEKALSAQTGLKLIIDYQVDPEVIGGVRFQAGDTLIDSTLKTALKSLGHKLQMAQVH